MHLLHVFHIISIILPTVIFRFISEIQSSNGTPQGISMQFQNNFRRSNPACFFPLINILTHKLTKKTFGRDHSNNLRVEIINKNQFGGLLWRVNTNLEVEKWKRIIVKRHINSVSKSLKKNLSFLLTRPVVALWSKFVQPRGR